MITTTGNVRSSDMLYHWAGRESETGVKQIGIVVLVDEAVKDLEVNAWGPVVCEKWAAGVRGVFLFGDDKYVTSPSILSYFPLTHA